MLLLFYIFYIFNEPTKHISTELFFPFNKSQMKEFSEGNVGYNLSHKVRFLMTTRCVVFTLTVRPLRDGLCPPPPFPTHSPSFPGCSGNLQLSSRPHGHPCLIHEFPRLRPIHCYTVTVNLTHVRSVVCCNTL